MLLLRCNKNDKYSDLESYKEHVDDRSIEIINKLHNLGHFGTIEHETFAYILLYIKLGGPAITVPLYKNDKITNIDEKTMKDSFKHLCPIMWDQNGGM